jgi:tetratricopeptide (TPR) repeat protein
MGFFTGFFSHFKARKPRNRGLDALYQRNYLDAENAFLEVLEIDQEDSITWLNLGYALTGQKRFEEALGPLEKAVEFASPVNPAPRIALGMAYYELGRNDEARAELQTALKTDVKHPAAHYYLGLILLRENRLDEATEEFEEVISEKPTFVQARLLTIGETYLMKGKLPNILETHTNGKVCENTNHGTKGNNSGSKPDPQSTD